MDLVEIFNAIEASWWIGLGIVLVFRAGSRGSKRDRYLLAGALVVFGISDVIEVWTGAWWRPWWLAVLKVACCLGIGSFALLWFRSFEGGGRRLTPPPPPDTMP